MDIGESVDIEMRMYIITNEKDSQCQKISKSPMTAHGIYRQILFFLP